MLNLWSFRLEKTEIGKHENFRLTFQDVICNIHVTLSLNIYTLLDALVCSITVYYIDTSVLLENTPLAKFIQNHIRDLSGVFSTSSLVKISMIS